jgi:hypothetical protein
VPIGDGEFRCGPWTGVQICAPPAMGSHLLTWSCQLSRSRFAGSGSTNSTAIMAVSAGNAPDQQPDAESQQPADGQEQRPPMTACSTPGWLSVVLEWCEAS